MTYREAPEVWPEISALAPEDRRAVFCVALPCFDGLTIAVRASLRMARGFELGFLPADFTHGSDGRSAELAFTLAGDAACTCIPFELVWRSSLGPGTWSAGLLVLEVRLGTCGRPRVFEVPVVLSTSETRGTVHGSVTRALCRAIVSDLLREVREQPPSRALLDRIHTALGFVESRAGLAGVDVSDLLVALADARDELTSALEPRDVEVLRCWVAGTRFYEEAIFGERIVAGTSVRLERETDNPHDARAIAVRTVEGVKLGYVPRADNEVLANLMDAGVVLRGAILAIGQDAWRRLDMVVSMRAPATPEPPDERAPPCPACGRHGAKPILWGFPSDEGMKGAREGRWVLGGCCVWDGMPRWRCVECGNEFGRIEMPSEGEER